MTGVLAEVHVRDGLIAGNDAAQTAENILEHKMPFRLGIAANLTNFGPDVLSITARYVELCPRALN